MRKICTILDLPPPVTNKNFKRHCTKLLEAAKTTARASMKSAADALIAARTTAAEESPRDVAVSTDGTWMKRGFSSVYSVQTAISWDSQKVLDVEVLSKYCSLCTAKLALVRKGQITQEAYDM